MPTKLECMEFATGVYAASKLNYIDPPAGWMRVDWQPDAWDGFSADCYVNGTEMVISFTGAYCIDLVIDSGSSGTLNVNSTALTGSGATQRITDVYKNDTGYTYVKVNGGNTLIAFKENDPNHIIVNDYTAGSLGISLQGGLPTAPTATMTGDFKKQIDDHGSASAANNTYIYTMIEATKENTYEIRLERKSA